MADKKEEAIDEATSLCKTGGNAIQEIEPNLVPVHAEKTIPIIHPDTTKTYSPSAQIPKTIKPALSEIGPPSAVIHSPNNKRCKNIKTYNANGTAAPSNNEAKQGSNPECLTYPSSNSISGQQISSSVQYYNGVGSAEGLRQRNAANKNDNTKKSERSVSIQHTMDVPPLIDSAVSDLERTTSLKGITVFRGHVPGENSNSCSKPYVGCNSSGHSKNLSLTSNPNTRTSASATSCATSAITDGHIVHYGDEHVESYL